MILTRRILSSFVVVIILLIGFTIKPVPAKAIKNFMVEITPRVCGEVAEYKFQFTLEKELQVYEWIKFNFPQGTKLVPPLPDDEEANKQRRNEIIENIQFCHSADRPNDCAGLPIISFEKDGTLSIKINNWLTLDPAIEGYKDICMIINKKAGITNPGTPGAFTYRIATQAEPTYVESYPVEIKEQEVKSYSIDLSPKITNAIADYTFQLTFFGTLKPNQHKGFYFPPGTTLNPPMPEDETAKKARLRDIADAFSFGDRKSLGVEGYGLPIVEYIEDGYLNIRLAGGTEGLLIPDVPDGKTITMHFSKKAGICTPSKPGLYVYKFKTMLFPTMESQPIEITAKEKNKLIVVVSPAIIGEIAKYKFQFTIEKKIEVHQWFEISFPKGTTLNPPLPGIEKDRERKERLKEIIDAISFNIPCTSCQGMPIIQFPEDGTMTIQFHTPFEFNPADTKNNPVIITIMDSAGITNPGTPGTYTYKIRNQQELEFVDSQPVEITEKLPTPELEPVAQLPIYDQIMWLFAYPSVRKVKLPNDHPGFAYVKTLDGGWFETYYILGLYDTLEKRIVREIYLCSERDLKDNNYPSCKPAILVDENNMIYVTLKQQIYGFSNYLNLYDTLTPDLDSLHISSLLRLNFFKNNSIVALRDGIVLFIDKTSGVLTDHIAIDKSIDPDIKGLKTVSLQDYTKDSILMYFSVDETNAQNTQKVVAEVDITTKTIKQKWIINKENFPKIPYTNNFFSLSYADPWFIFWTPCASQNSTGVQLFIINTKTNQEILLELPLCSVTDQWLENEGNTLFAYNRCPDGSNDNRQEGIYRIALNGFLP